MDNNETKVYKIVSVEPDGRTLRSAIVRNQIGWTVEYVVGQFVHPTQPHTGLLAFNRLEAAREFAITEGFDHYPKSLRIYRAVGRAVSPLTRMSVAGERMDLARRFWDWYWSGAQVSDAKSLNFYIDTPPSGTVVCQEIKLIAPVRPQYLK